MEFSKHRDAERMIGTILVDAGRLTEEGVERIREAQNGRNVPFGEVGIELGLLTQADVMYALSLQFDYPYIAGPILPVDEEVVVAYRPFSPEGESFRSLRSQLQLRWSSDAGKRTALAVVSARPGEGRSHLAANLAVSFAQAGEHTLLIDANLRSPRQHRLFKLDNNVGLSNLLAGRTHDQVIKFVPGIPGLAVLPSGPPPPNPEELLGRSTFDRILGQSMSTFDVIIIDSPSMAAGTDATLLARFAGAAIAVARSNQTRTGEFRDMVGYLNGAGVDVVGSVLVDVPRQSGKRA